jgi:OOP family OmpA-OmpF porin
MKLRSLIIFAGLATLECGAAYGDSYQNYNDSWYVAPQYSYAWPDSKRDVKDGGGWQLAIGKPVSDDWNLECSAIDYKTDFKDGIPGSSHQTTYGLNGLWFFGGRNSGFSPFAELGGGAIDRRSRYTSGKTNGYGTLGIGFLTSPWDWSGSLRLGVR